MTETGIVITIDRRRDPGVIAALEAGLDTETPEHLRAPRPPIVVVARAGVELVGGLAAEIVGDWLHVELLWVAEAARGQGLGSELLRQAEEAAAADGCSRAYLSTLATQAPDFYRRHGYVPIASFPSFAGPHARIWFAKRLTSRLPVVAPAHRLRASALVFREDRLLVVARHDRVSGSQWWAPPGGEIEEDEPITACAVRETLEETGLAVRVGRLAYVHDLILPHLCRRTVEFFFLAQADGGSLREEQAAADRPHRVAFLTQPQMAQAPVLPAFLQIVLWEDRAAGFPTVRTIGPEVANG